MNKSKVVLFLLAHGVCFASLLDWVPGTGCDVPGKLSV